MLKRIQEEICRLENYKKQAIETIDFSKEGKLKCAQNKGHAQYYLNGVYIPKKDRDIAKKAASSNYARKLDKKIDNYLLFLEKLKDLYVQEELEEVFRRLNRNRQDLFEPIVKPIEYIINEFEKEMYDGKLYDENSTKVYITMKGEQVRSKSEKIIADELFRCGIPYKYEMPIELMNWNRVIKVYPDFTVLNRRTGRKWILEHLGMMDNQLYYDNAIQKLDLYEKNGLLIGRDVLLLHETSANPLDVKVMRRYIEEYLC